MLSKKIECEGVCYPVAALYNSNKEFIGYMMPKAKGKELQKSIFIKPLFLKNFPNWKKRDTVELCITILEKIKYLHDRNIVMGDINPANILIVSPKEVYFVDTDSYQVEDFPCPVGTNNYTAPEIQRKHFSDFLRTMGNENFAVATLLFMIMLPGKPPYSQQGGEDPINNIIKMDFSYPLYNKKERKLADVLKKIMQMSTIVPADKIEEQLKQSFENVIINATTDDCSIAMLVKTDAAFKGYLRLNNEQKCKLLGIGSGTPKKIIRRYDDILICLKDKQSVSQIARMIHLKPKYTKKYVNKLCMLNFIEKDGSCYRTIVVMHIGNEKNIE